MSMLTKADFEQHIAGYEKIDSAIRDLADRYIDTFDPGSTIINVEVECDGAGGTITVSTEYNTCSCCGSDFAEHEIPMRYLWEGDWLAQEQAKIDEQMRLAAEEKRIKEEEQKQEAAKREYQRYVALKEKYE